MTHHSRLKSGTPCYLVALLESPNMIGRAVEVVSGRVSLPEENDEVYVVEAPWLSETYLGRDVLVSRRNLRPIDPPAPGLPALGYRPPDHARALFERLALDLAAMERSIAELEEQAMQAQAALAQIRKLLLDVLWPRPVCKET